MVYKNCVLYQDLSADPLLFEATGDYQFDIYRHMQRDTHGCWDHFEPHTNVYWLHYLIDKMINGARYSSRKAQKHRNAIAELMKMRDYFLDYKSACDYAENY